MDFRFYRIELEKKNTFNLDLFVSKKYYLFKIYVVLKIFSKSRHFGKKNLVAYYLFFYFVRIYSTEILKQFMDIA